MSEIVNYRALAVEVRRLRAEGWVLPKFRLAMGHGERGILRVRQEDVPTLNRHCLVARLYDTDNGSEIADLPPLHDAALLHLSPEEMVLSGFERIESVGRVIDFAQSWRIKPVTG